MANPVATTRALILFALLPAGALSWTPRAHAQAAAEAPSAKDTSEENGGRKAKPDRFEWLVVTADVGYRLVDLNKIEYDDDGGAHGRVIPATSGGFSPGLALGVRLWFVSLMLRADVTLLSESGSVLRDELELWNLDLESAFRLMQGRLQPYLLLGIGYSALGGVGDVIDNVTAEAHGANARFGLGFDYYVHPHITVGFRAHADGLLLASRVSVGELTTPEKVDTLGETKMRLREADGSIAGLCYVAGLTFGLHYL